MSYDPPIAGMTYGAVKVGTVGSGSGRVVLRLGSVSKFQPRPIEGMATEGHGPLFGRRQVRSNPITLLQSGMYRHSWHEYTVLYQLRSSKPHLRACLRYIPVLILHYLSPRYSVALCTVLRRVAPKRAAPTERPGGHALNAPTRPPAHRGRQPIPLKPCQANQALNYPYSVDSHRLTAQVEISIRRPCGRKDQQHDSPTAPSPGPWAWGRQGREPLPLRVIVGPGRKTR